jgi:hypothetical protein
MINPSVSGWERVAMAIEEVRDRLLRSTAALEGGGVPYAVIGGNAVAEWVGRIDKGAVRFTKDVDLLMRRSDLPRAIEVMKQAGFFYDTAFGVSLFLDGPQSSPRDAVHLLFSGEKVRPADLLAPPDVTEVEEAERFKIVSLEGLVQMKLTSFRDRDRVHLRDMLDVGLIDASWPSRFPAPLADRLQELIDHPE